MVSPVLCRPNRAVCTRETGPMETPTHGGIATPCEAPTPWQARTSLTKTVYSFVHDGASLSSCESGENGILTPVRALRARASWGPPPSGLTTGWFRNAPRFILFQFRRIWWLTVRATRQGRATPSWVCCFQ
jgi:hypothetical protein